MSDTENSFGKILADGADITAEQVNREMVMFGDTKTNILDAFDASFGDIKIKLMGRLSDAQELIEMGRGEDARQVLNQAKMLMMERG